MIRSWKPKIDVAVGDLNFARLGVSELKEPSFLAGLGTPGYVAPEVIEDDSSPPKKHVPLRTNIRR